MTSALMAWALLASTTMPPELGDVAWGRDFEAALRTAKSDGRPVLVLFDEVPGCQTCVRYGQSVLRHRLLVEAAETLFVPVAIYNNQGGKDREVLKRYREPTWNNPVVRIVDGRGQNLVPRLAGDYRVASLAERMTSALRAVGQDIPPWLDLVVAEGRPTVRAYLGMHCFWTGEACLGALDGVLATRTGWLGGGEVVEVELDREKAEEVLLRAAKAGCATRFLVPEKSAVDARVLRSRGVRLEQVRASDFRPTPRDDRHVLRRSPLASLDLTALQSTRVNASLARREDPSRWLSPRQRREAEHLREGSESRSSR